VSHDAYRESYGALLPQIDFIARGGYGVRRNDTTIVQESDGQGEGWSDEQRLVLSQLLSTGGPDAFQSRGGQAVFSLQEAGTVQYAEDGSEAQRSTSWR
jgi:hypothetical protein